MYSVDEADANNGLTHKSYVPQFCSLDIQEAVLSSMLHHDRRELHRRAAHLAGAKLDEAIDEQGQSRTDYRIWKLHHARFFHFLGIVKAESSILKRHATLEDLKGIMSSGKWLGDNCCSTGRIEEGMKISVSWDRAP